MASRCCLLVAVEVAGHVGLGAQRWIELGPLELQPSELMKISLVLALARYPARQERRRKCPSRCDSGHGACDDRAPGGARAAAAQSRHRADHRVPMACSLLFLAGLSWWWIVPAVSAVADRRCRSPGNSCCTIIRRRRVLTFLNPESDALGAGWNITQAKIAIGSGGVAGKGFLQGTQSRLNFLPEKQTDFIFTMFGEEFGFVGCIALLVAVRGGDLSTASRSRWRSRSQFGRLLAMGMTLNFFFYIMINALDGDGPDPGGRHSHAADLLWRHARC